MLVGAQALKCWPFSIAHFGTIWHPSKYQFPVKTENKQTRQTDKQTKKQANTYKNGNNKQNKTPE